MNNFEELVKYYILDDNNNVVETDVVTGVLFRFGHFSRCIVGKYNDGLIVVSTVFCGMELPTLEGRKLFFETKVWGKTTELTTRYATWAEAEENRRRVEMERLILTQLQTKGENI